MNHHKSHRMSAPSPGDPGIAGRVAERGRALGLSMGQVARRAGMAPRYLNDLLRQDTDFDPDGLLRVAAALSMSYPELLHGPSHPPPGQAAPAPRPSLRSLTTAECWDLVGGHGVGRIALAGAAAPVVIPVNYTVDARTVVYRTSPGSAACPESGQAVSFQVDRVDDRLSQGWSVLITGTAERVRDEETERRLAAAEGEGPWAGGPRPVWTRIRPGAVSGRRVESGLEPEPGGGAARSEATYRPQ
ncbi:MULTISPECIES: pyridoxamine 5'-phosphate oxidase family protein [unclassified Streptomyces]|uniref:helix-turn-helix domain-containing protein n=1 Tax=unclassified Streptomyces TaxID=2593676 RepID=UPI0036EFEDAD